MDKNLESNFKWRQVSFVFPISCLPSAFAFTYGLYNVVQLFWGLSIPPQFWCARICILLIFGHLGLEAARQNKKPANTQESTRQLRLWLPFWPRFRLTCIKVIDRHFKVRKRRKKQKLPNEDLYSQKTNLHRFGFRIFKGQLKLLAKHWAPDCFCLFSFSYTSSSEYCGFCGFSFNV